MDYMIVYTHTFTCMYDCGLLNSKTIASRDLLVLLVPQNNPVATLSDSTG